MWAPCACEMGRRRQCPKIAESQTRSRRDHGIRSPTPAFHSSAHTEVTCSRSQLERIGATGPPALLPPSQCEGDLRRKGKLRVSKGNPVARDTGQVLALESGTPWRSLCFNHPELTLCEATTLATSWEFGVGDPNIFPLPTVHIVSCEAGCFFLIFIVMSTALVQGVHDRRGEGGIGQVH